MRSVHRTVAVGLLAVVLAALATPAFAGGSLANVEPRRGHQGSEIRLSGTFCNGSQAPVSAGPWFAYLDPRKSPPVLLGRVTITPNTGNLCQWRLKATLQVPAVAPGAYWIQVCDRGCMRGVGDLIGAGRFVVVGAESPRDRTASLEALRARLRASMREQARQERKLRELEGSLTRVEAETARVATLADSLGDQLVDEQNERGAWFGAAVTSVAFVLAASSVLIWRRRRRSRIDVPDTPAELLERAHARR